jgi:acetyl esterase/lipase
MKRRTLIQHALACSALALARPLRLAAAEMPAPAAAISTLPLWDRMIPGGDKITGEPQRSAKGALSHVVTPMLEVFTPARPNGSAALIAGGGGYKRIQMASEAYPAARWLAQRGVTAFVLDYRLPGDGWAAGPLAPLQDAQRAIRLIRARAHAYGLDPSRILALGFSAGGHLMGMAAARPDFASYPAQDAVDELPAQVSAAALIYAVVTLRAPYDNTSTRRVLIGNHPSASESADWSVDNWIGKQMPPLFAVQAQDDPIADPANIAILSQAASQAGVPVETHRLSAGGHGFGMGKAGSPSAEWPTWFEHWLRERGLVA